MGFLSDKDEKAAMKMIKPIVNISKVIDIYDTIVVGLEGVICAGSSVKVDAVNALINIKKAGKNIVLLTSSAKRVAEIAELLQKNKLPPQIFSSIVSSGEIMHYLFKSPESSLSKLSRNYFLLGNPADASVFAGLDDYHEVSSLSQADFIFIGSVKSIDDNLETYLPLLEQAASMSVPMVAAGNDASSFMDGEVCLAAGAVAEQYAALGGRIITVGKPDQKILFYALEDIPNFAPEQTLLIGDNITSDIRAANLAGLHCMLVSKGVHVNYLGEGYIPDVAKTREIAVNYDAYPDYVISNLRW